MAFWGNEFIFDGISCSDFGLMVYHFGSEGQDDISYSNNGIVEESISGRYDTLFYGTEQNKPLEFKLVFGANMEAVDKNKPLDRYETEAVAAWLTGHGSRKWLSIVQDDMSYFRYKCVISDLKLITYGDMPWAFSCKVRCDSPFGYTLPEETVFDCNGQADIKFFNRSSYNGYYFPKIEISVLGGNDISIQNLSDNGREFSFKGLPESEGLTITIDNKNGIITNSLDINLYQYFNMKFLRLKRGYNDLKLTGNMSIRFVCEFPVNIGG